VVETSGSSSHLWFPKCLSFSRSKYCRTFVEAQILLKLLDIVRRRQSKTPSLIFEFINNTNFKVLYLMLLDFDI